MQSVEVAELTTIKGIAFPAGVRFRQILVTGPPCSGKSTLVAKLGGWPQEGYLDLAGKWWHSQTLTFRPREVHLGLPFVGHAESCAVFDKEWLLDPAPLDPPQIRIPPEKRWFWSTDWRRKLVFNFQLIPAETIYEVRKTRSERGTHPIDVDLTWERVQRQVAIHEEVALYLHRCGLRVFFRDSFEGPPRRFI